MRKIFLQLFVDPTYSVTCQKDSGITTFSASPNSSVAKDADVALTITPATGYELDEIIVAAGGVTPVYDADDGWGFVMGEANVTLFAKSKKNNLYRVTETVPIWINDSKTVLTKNTEVVLTKQGGIADVKATPVELTVNDAIQGLIDQGILVKV